MDRRPRCVVCEQGARGELEWGRPSGRAARDRACLLALGLLVGGCTEPAPLGLTGELLSPQVIALDVTLPRAGALDVLCTSPDDPEERLLVTSSTPAKHHAPRVPGLLPDTRYDCQIATSRGVASDVVSLRTGEVPELPELLVDGAPSYAYSLFNTQLGVRGGKQNSGYVVVADPEGRARWVYEVGNQLIVDIDAARVDGGFHIGGGWGWIGENLPNRGVFVDLNDAGEVLLRRDAPDVGLGFNHHSERLADGATLGLTFSDDHLGDVAWTGVGIELWHPERGVVWSWTSQELVDDGQVAEAYPEGGSPYHANAVAFVDDDVGEAAWVSLYFARQLWRIDRATGARTDTFGLRGDFTLYDTSGALLPEEQWPHVQHGPDWTEDGRVLMYDNGTHRPGQLQSRVVEYAVDVARREATLLWQWSEPGWYDPQLGDADYLPNGNILIAKGFILAASPASAVQASQVVEVTRDGEVVFRLSVGDPEWPLFRAQAIDGCDLFANGRYCEATDAAIAEFGRRQ
jgi:hypothetical protein